MADAANTNRLLKELEQHTYDLQRIAKMTDPEWIVPGYLPEGCLIVLYGAPGTCKTLLALDWSLSIAYGRPWNGLAVKSGPVLYVFSEGVFGLKQRVQAWQAAAYEHPRLDAPFLVVPHPLLIDEPSTVDALRLYLGRVQPTIKLIVIDTLARCMNGKENETSDMNLFIRGCDGLRKAFEKQGLSVLVVHHTGKDEDRGARGSTALKGACDVMWTIKNKSDTDLTLHNERQKDADKIPDSVWDIEPSGASCVLRPSDKKPRTTRVTKSEPSDAEIMQEMWLALKKHGRPMIRAAWMRICPKMGNPRFNRLYKQLIVDERVARVEDARYMPLDKPATGSHMTQTELDAPTEGETE